MGASRRSKPNPAAGVGAGAQRTWDPAWGFLVLAAVIVAAGLTFFLMSAPAPVLVVAQPTSPAQTLPQPGASGVKGMEPAPTAPRALATAAPGLSAVPMVEGVDPTPDLSTYVNRGEKPSMNEVIDRLNRAGIETGLAAFSPPGTRPPMVGLAVPEDFELPPGYVRHHQATDDGQRIEAILMFAPDFPVRNAANQPIAMPKDRLVPPDLVPPGFPVRRVVIPAPKETGGPGL